MNFILDSSCALSWVFEDETSPESEKPLEWLNKGAKAFVPPLWRWEMANVLIIAERRKRITSVEVNSHLSFFQTLPIEIDEATVNQAWNGTRILAQAHQLTIYDAAYLELAIRRGLPLATLDTALQSACKLEKVRLATLI